MSERKNHQISFTNRSSNMFLKLPIVVLVALVLKANAHPSNKVLDCKY